jgi:hypothetical protein
MSISELEFKISETVGSLTQEYLEYTPPSGATVTIVDFIAEAAYEKDINISIVWDLEGIEQNLWSIKGSGRFNNKITIPNTDTDGIKKLALVLDNGTFGSLIMSGWMVILVDTNE